MGLAAPSAGTVTWGGRAQSGVERRAFVFQRPVMMRRTAAQNIAFALSRLDRAAKQKRIEKALARTGLTALADRPARRLSGGEQQRLAIARALAREPEVLFLDEPTSNLDPAAAKAIEAIIRDATLSGIKIVMATHDLGQARRLASEIIFLVGGALAEHGPSERFFSQPATPQAAAFLRGDIVE
jgi:tungstate transport system ATP-binding protein